MADIHYQIEPGLGIDEFIDVLRCSTLAERRPVHDVLTITAILANADVTHAAAGMATSLILLAAPAAETYYPHIGMQHHHSSWPIPPDRGSKPSHVA